MKEYSARQIANWFVEQSLNDPSCLPDLTPAKLQCLLYYAQCHFLNKTGVALFSEEIEAWNDGPVIPEIDQAYFSFGQNQIQSISPELHIEPKGKTLTALQDTLKSEGALTVKQLAAKIRQEALTKKPMSRKNITRCL